MKKQPTEITREQALDRLRTLCARSEMCTYDVRRKLLAWKISGGDARDIINELIDGEYINDIRFAHAFANDKLRFSGWGRMKIRNGLYAKGVAREVIAEAIEDLDPELYRQTLLAVLRSQYRKTARPDDSHVDLRLRLLRFAHSRGFEPQLTQALLRDREVWTWDD